MPTSFDAVLAAELAEIDQRRKHNGWPGIAAAKDSTEQALDSGLLGVGLSGGGIRSATFNLGLLQGFCRKGLLPYVDYLSTVSGGGYIGSWLHGVIERYDGGDPRQTQQRLLEPVPKPPDQDPIAWLRKFSNYLAPRVSPFSTDVWALIALWLRNFLLNQCVLISFLAAVLMTPLLIGRVHHRLDWVDPWWWTSAVLMLIAVFSIGMRLREIADRELDVPSPFTAPALAPDAGLCAMLVFIACALAGWTQTDPLIWPGWNKYFAAGGLFLLFVLLQGTGGFAHCFNIQKKSKMGHAFLLLWPPISAALSTALLLGSFYLMRDWDAWDAVAWGPALVAGSLMAGVALLVGLMGADYPDACREWLSRTGSTIAMMIAGWCAFFALGVFAPLWVAQLFDNYWGTAIALAGGWLATSAAGVAAGRSARTANDKGKSPLEYVVKFAPTVFLVGYLILIAMGCHVLLRKWSGHDQAYEARSDLQTRVRIEWTTKGTAAPGEGVGKTTLEREDLGGPAWARTIIGNHWNFLHDKSDNSLWMVLAAVLAMFGVSVGLGSRVNINEFSIHHLYKNRLVRCYLGASQGTHRRPNAWTGFDPKDDLKIASLLPKNNYFGPFAIVNAALNLNTGSELAKQDRKASSFVFTPLFSGYKPESGDGYVDTTNYSQTNGPALGTCMGISGAAANPNMGYHTSGPMAFLLTVFNVRLGWWLGNPRLPKYAARTGPAFALPYLLNELLGRTNDRSNYLNLSDGGHFDNIGLYELVRRRCRYIIIGDGEQDAAYSFGSLASTVRRCRADFGVEIDLDFNRIRLAAGLSTVHSVIGTITYPEADAAGNKYRGIILYIKASITGDEPEDIKEFRSRFPEFPHQSTGDQFFDEAQFESYRKLGFHVAQSTFEQTPALVGGPAGALSGLFDKLHQRLYPPSPIAPGVATRHTEAYSALMARLAADPDLRYLDAEVLPGATPAPKSTDPDVLRRGRFFCIDCIQLMENVYYDLGLNHERERMNPNNGGWLRVFQYWASKPEFQAAWAQAQTTYNPLFQDFYNSL